MKLKKVLAKLEDPDEASRKTARDQLEQLIKEGVSVADGRLILAAAAKDWPYPIRWAEKDDALLRCFYRHMRSEYAETVVEYYPKYSPGGRKVAMNLLGRQKEPVYLEAYVEILRRHAREGLVEDLCGHVVNSSDPIVAEVLFPALFEFLDVRPLAGDILGLAFDAVRSGALARHALAQVCLKILALLSDLRVRLGPAQNSGGTQWMWEESYRADRMLAGMLLDLCADVPAPSVADEVRHWLKMSDPRLLVFSGLSLLKLSQGVDAETIHRAASFPELRIELYDQLQQLGRGDLYPAEFADQLSFAEADMVRWLTFPTELNSAPDEIVAANVLRYRDPEAGLVGLYVFRFRTLEPHWSAKDGWMAGVAGPFPLSGLPTTQPAGSMTFSKFTAWEKMSVVQHALDIAGKLPDFEILEPGEEYK